MLQMWEEDPEHFAHAMGTDDPFRSKAEALLLTLLEVGLSRTVTSSRIRLSLTHDLHTDAWLTPHTQCK